MMFADMFHQFGLSNEEAFMAAQHSTNMAMGDYHAAERPHIYSQLGVMGEFGGALTTFKHNALTNFWIKGRDAVVKDSAGNRHLTPALIALAGVALFQGIKGAPGYDDLDSVVQWATSLMGERKSISELALDYAPNWLSNGFCPQSLDSTSRVVPAWLEFFLRHSGPACLHNTQCLLILELKHMSMVSTKINKALMTL